MSQTTEAPNDSRRRLRLVLVLALLAALVVLAVVSVDRVQLMLGIGYPERTGAPMLVIAHRGDVDRFPEDTREAIEAAAAGNAAGIEFDVQRSADGVWYVIHDATLDRTTDLSGSIDSLGSAEIESATIDGGLGFRPEHAGLTVPRLADVLAGLEDYEGSIILDLQHTPSGNAGEVARMLDGQQATLFVGSREDIESIRAVDPRLTVVARRWVAPGQVDGILMDAVAEATVGRVGDTDVPVWVYVDEGSFSDDETGVIRRAWAAGVHAFLSKHPEQAVAIVDELQDAREASASG